MSVEVAASVPSDEGVSEVPETPVHTDRDCLDHGLDLIDLPVRRLVCRKDGDGLCAERVLHWRLIVPGVEISKRVSCGQEVPPDSDAGWRHVRHGCSQIVGPRGSGGDLQQEEATRRANCRVLCEN